MVPANVSFQLDSKKGPQMNHKKLNSNGETLKIFAL